MSSTDHILIIPIGARSHIRLLLQLTLNLLNLHPSAITTTLITQINHGILQEEIDLHPKAVIQAVEDRFRIVHVEDGLDHSDKSNNSIMTENNVLKEKIGLYLEDLIGAKGEGKWGTKPCLVICDIFRLFVRTKVKEAALKLGLDAIPVVHFGPSMAVTMHRFANSTENHGSTEQMVERYDQNRKEGMEEIAAARKAFRFVHNVLLEWPDLPPMYDYEYSTFSSLHPAAVWLLRQSPQAENRIITPVVCMVQNIIWQASRDTDGVICLSVPELDGKSLERLAEIQGVPVIGIGPQFNESVWNAEEHHSESHSNDDEARIIHFLDDALASHGRNSVAYVSLGTTAWPTLRPGIIEIIVDSLMAANVPFVFATAYPDGKMDPELVKKVNGSGVGLVVEWAPQVRVLRHQATGVFLTHCGFGSMTEAIVTETPIIAMPFTADQPTLAAYFTQIQKIGIHLYQVSSNPGLTLGNGIKVTSTDSAIREELDAAWVAMRGTEGEVYRRNVRNLRTLMRKSMDSGGAKEGLKSIERWFPAK